MSGKDGGKVRGPRGRTASCLTCEHHFAAGEYQFWDKHPHHHAQPHERESWIYDVVFCSVCYPPELRRLIREEEKARKVVLREKESENRTDFKSIQDQMERLTTQVETMSGQVVDLQGKWRGLKVKCGGWRSFKGGCGKVSANSRRQPRLRSRRRPRLRSW